MTAVAPIGVRLTNNEDDTTPETPKKTRSVHDVMRLPKPKHLLNHTPTADTDDTKKKNHDFDQLKDSGYKLPTVLEKLSHSMDKIVKAWRLVNQGLDKFCDLVTSLVGFPLKYVGIGLLLAGGIHFMIVLCSTPPATVAAGGLIVVVMALIKSGALPTVIAGATLYKFGKDLMENKSIPSLSFVSWILPTPFYNMLNMDDPTQNPDPSKMPM